MNAASSRLEMRLRAMITSTRGPLMEPPVPLQPPLGTARALRLVPGPPAVQRIFDLTLTRTTFEFVTWAPRRSAKSRALAQVPSARRLPGCPGRAGHDGVLPRLMHTDAV